MTRPSREERLRQAVATATRCLAAHREQAASRSGPPAPGDLYVLPGISRIALEWLVVRAHPDQADEVFVAPVDDCPLLGPPDAPLPETLALRPLTARCGQGTWVPARFLPQEHRVGALPAEALALVRAAVANLAAGVFVNDPLRDAADDDPTYVAWMARVERARLKLEHQVERPALVLPLSSFQSEAPADLAAETPRAMAAGGPLTQQLTEALGQANEPVQFHELRGAGPGKLLLIATGQGVWVVWKGEERDRPPVEGWGEDEQARSAAWDRPSGEQGVTMTSTPFPWRYGRVLLRIGQHRPLEVTITQ